MFRLRFIPRFLLPRELCRLEGITFMAILR
jgi:hypothetical protein